LRYSERRDFKVSSGREIFGMLGILLLIYTGAAPIDLVPRFCADRTACKQTAQIDMVS
jgi:hypothetical protein